MTITSAPPVYRIGQDNGAGGAGGGSAVSQRMDEGQDRFLKLLVAQMSNQDPLSPLDNAQVTSQLAQISTVNSVEQLNRTMSQFVGQYGAQQALQAASLVGRGVMVDGDRMRVMDVGEDRRVAHGGFEVAGEASNVRLEVLDGAGNVLDTVTLGDARAGRHPFSYDASAHAVGDELSFRVVSGSPGNVTQHATYSVGFVDAVSLNGSDIALEMGWLGSIPYTQARTVI